MGKGRKERVGAAAGDGARRPGRRTWNSAGAPACWPSRSSPRCDAGAKGEDQPPRRLGERDVRRILRQRGMASRAWPSACTRTACATASRPTCSTWAPTCARSRSCWDTPACRPPRSTPPCRPSACARCTTRRTRVPARAALPPVPNPRPPRRRSAQMKLGDPVRATTVAAVVRDGTDRDGRRRPGDRRRHRHEAGRGEGPQGGEGEARSWASPAAPPTRWRCWSAWRESSRRTAGNIRRAAVELARDWRTDRMLRRLEALLLVGDPADAAGRLGQRRRDRARRRHRGDRLGGRLCSGCGARAGAAHRASRPTRSAREALQIASEICIYTNDQIHVVSLP